MAKQPGAFTVQDRDALAEDIILNNQAPSILHCLNNARMNATQVAPVELIRAISAAIMDLEEADVGSLNSLQQVVNVTDGIATHIAGIYETIEERLVWAGVVDRGRGVSPVRTITKSRRWAYFQRNK